MSIHNQTNEATLRSEEKNASHTPGPWEISEFRGKSRVRINGLGWGSLAKVVVRLQPDVNDYPEGLANARLIAAAPELLRALIDLSDWLSYGLNKADGAEPTAEDHAACERVAAQARAAVDKATGVSS